MPLHHRARLYACHTEVEKDYRAHPFSGEEIAAAAEKYQKRYRGGQQLYRAYGTTLIAGTTKSTSRGSTAP
ncbi:hypothetical protein AGMMS50268_01130 [Spirochaetia bacterium]|nr:hypothetical protein AGMMS50268_01130 [Spirochaetia bacterium]